MEEEAIIAYISIIREKIKNIINGLLREKNIKGILSSHGLVLFTLYRNGGQMQMKDLAQYIGRRKSTVTDLIKKLVELNLVKKIESDNDGRVAYAVLTEEAYEFKDFFDEVALKVKGICFKDINKTELKALSLSLKKIMKNL